MFAVYFKDSDRKEIKMRIVTAENQAKAKQAIRSAYNTKAIGYVIELKGCSGYDL